MKLLRGFASCLAKQACALPSRDSFSYTTLPPSPSAWFVFRLFTCAESVLTFNIQNILVQSSYWLDYERLWSTWPSRELSGELKWYFLVQLAFYLQSIFAINLEKRRKDFGQMLLHHCVTSFLMYVAYAYRWTNVGNVILCIMDVVDFLLPVCAFAYLSY